MLEHTTTESEVLFVQGNSWIDRASFHSTDMVNLYAAKWFPASARYEMRNSWWTTHTPKFTRQLYAEIWNNRAVHQWRNHDYRIELGHAEQTWRAVRLHFAEYHISTIIRIFSLLPTRIGLSLISVRALWLLVKGLNSYIFGLIFGLPCARFAFSFLTWSPSERALTSHP